MPTTSPPSPPSLAAIFDASSAEALCVAEHPVQALLLVSSTIEPGLAQYADSVRERMVREHHSGLLLFNVLCPPPCWLASSKEPKDPEDTESSWVARWTPAADGGWLTRDSDLVLCELANALGASWLDLPALVLATNLTGGEALCLPTSAERFPAQLRTLRELCAAPCDLEQLERQLEGAERRRVDQPRLRDLMGTIDLGVRAWWAERARRELGRPWRDAVDPELRARLAGYRVDYRARAEEQLTQARLRVDRLAQGERLVGLEQVAERLGPVALVGELLGDFSSVRLPRGLEPTARRLLETALRVAILLEGVPHPTLDPGVAAVCLWRGLERELNHAWFASLAGGFCPLDEVPRRLAAVEEALERQGIDALRDEHLEALARVLRQRRRYLEGHALTIANLRRQIADVLHSGLLASLRPTREALLSISH